MLVTEPEVLDMLLEPVVLLLRSYASQMHPVITAILRGSVPVGLRERIRYDNIIRSPLFFGSRFGRRRLGALFPEEKCSFKVDR